MVAGLTGSVGFGSHSFVHSRNSYCKSESSEMCKKLINFRNAPWIGLQKTISGHYWNSGPACQMTSASYRGWKTNEEIQDKTAYTFQTNAIWLNVRENVLSVYAVCRLGK